MRVIKSLAALCVAVISLSACNQTRETILGNGLKIIVKEDHRSPVLVSQIWYRVGGVDEPRGITGVSHVLEHMMFKGTEKHGPGEFSRIIAEQGGRENAFTSRDYTAYFQTLEKSRLAIAFELEADRMQHLRLDEKEFTKEVQVVLEERRLRTDDKPEGRLYEKFSATAYKVHPYGNPIIGWPDDLAKLTVKDTQQWYRRWYAPNNATLVVVGDVKPSAVFKLAKTHFGSIARREIKRIPLKKEPKQDKPRRVTVRIPAKVPSMLIGFHVPVFGQTGKAWEPYALDVLAGILDGGKSARIYRQLIQRQQVAASAGAGYNSIARGSTLFLLSATPAPGKTVQDVEKALLEQINRVQHEEITDNEMQRIKAQVVASDVFQRDSVFYQAMEIGMLEAVGLDHRLADDYVEKINAVSAGQVREVARKYLIQTNMTVAILDPLPFDYKGRKNQSTSRGRRAH